MKFPRVTLRTQIAALVALLAAVAFFASDRLVRASVDRDLENALKGQLETFARLVAGQLDRDLGRLRADLNAAADLCLNSPSLPDELPPVHQINARIRQAASDPLHQLKNYFRFRKTPTEPDRDGIGNLYLFDYGLLLLDAKGRLLDDSRKRPALLNANPGADFAFADYFRAARDKKQPGGIVSSPYISALDPFPPVVMFAVPLYTRNPAFPNNIPDTAPPTLFQGVLCGGLDLSRNPLLARYTDLPFGDGGVIALVTPGGRVVAHTDRERVLATTHMEYNELASRVHWLKQDGRRGLSVAIPLQSVPWRLEVWQPTDALRDAFLSGWNAARMRFLFWGALGVLAAWLLGGWLTRDLARLETDVRRLGDAYGPADRVRSRGWGEAGVLADAVNQLLATVETARADVRQLTVELARAEERERRAIAVDLHDSVCQTLAVANLELGRVKQRIARAAAPPPDAGATPAVDTGGLNGLAEEVERARSWVTEGVKELRTLIFDLSPPILYELGLPAALAWLAGRFVERFGVPLRVEDVSGDAGVPETAARSETAMFLYRAAREAAVNAAKHARASEIVVRLEWLPPEPDAQRPRGRWRVTVADDGVGFEASRAFEGGKKDHAGGFGLRTLRERLDYLGGVMQVDSAPGRGARIRLEAPIDEE